MSCPISRIKYMPKPKSWRCPANPLRPDIPQIKVKC